MAPVYEFGLIGCPLGHSLSPQLHRAALKAVGMNGEYRLYSIPPDHNDSDHSLKYLIRRILTGEITGLNITIPYKQKVIGYLDRLTPIADQVEAVNTIYLENGQLVGDNTDVPGFLKDVKAKVAWKNGDSEAMVDRLPDTALVLGAGGSARAIVYALATQGKRIYLVSRRIEQADMIVESLKKKAPGIFISKPVTEAMSLSEMYRLIEGFHNQEILLVNTTPVGMWPDINHSPWPETVDFPAHALVYDLIYNPCETMLMRQAINSGLRAWNGMGMLVEQAALAFARWTGIQSSGTVMWESLQYMDQIPYPTDE